MANVAEQLDAIEAKIMGGLKDFQQATVERIDYLYRHDQRRVLVSDEVGLGKTLIARGTVAKLAKLRREEGDSLFKVVYICSNAAIADQNLRKLRVAHEARTESTSSSRLSMQHLNIFRQENDAELRPQGGNRTGQNRNGHDVEDRVDQQIVGGVHHGVEHIGGTHFGAQQDEEAEEDHNENGNFFADGLFHAFWQNFFFFLFEHFRYLSPEGKTNLYINRRNYSVPNQGSQGRNE